MIITWYYSSNDITEAYSDGVKSVDMLFSVAMATGSLSSKIISSGTNLYKIKWMTEPEGGV